MCRLRVRFHIIRNVRIENVGKYQSCMVSKLRVIWKQTVEEVETLQLPRGEVELRQVIKVRGPIETASGWELNLWVRKGRDVRTHSVSARSQAEAEQVTIQCAHVTRKNGRKISVVHGFFQSGRGV